MNCNIQLARPLVQQTASHADLYMYSRAVPQWILPRPKHPPHRYSQRTSSFASSQQQTLSTTIHTMKSTLLSLLIVSMCPQALFAAPTDAGGSESPSAHPRYKYATRAEVVARFKSASRTTGAVKRQTSPGLFATCADSLPAAAGRTVYATFINYRSASPVSAVILNLLCTSAAVRQLLLAR